MKQRKPQPESILLITELKRLRLDAHNRLQEAEWRFMQADRALNAAKRRERDKEVQE